MTTFILNSAPVAGTTFAGTIGDTTDTLELHTIAGIAPAGSSLFPDGIATTSYGLLGTTTLTSIERLDFQSLAGTGLNLLLGFGGQTIAGSQTPIPGQAVPFPNQVGNGLSATAELIGGAGTDVLQLVASGVSSGVTIAGGSGAVTAGSYTFTAPSFTYTNWSTTDRAYRPSDRVAIVVVGTPGSVTLNGSAHVGVQVLSSGSGNDNVNGSNDMDLISGGAGVDQLYGNGGDDTFLATNVIPNNGNGVPGSENTQTFAGSLFDGGAGTDFLAVGGNVNFQGALVSIEGLYLQPAYSNNLPNNASQLATVLTISGTTLAGLPSNLIIDGEGEVIVNLAQGEVFNGSGYVFDAASDVHFKINGTNGNNVIAGTANADRIVSGGGQDNLQSGNGDDTIVLEALLAGGSTVNGGTGTDTLELHTIAGIVSAGSSLFPDGIATTSYGLLGTTTLTSIERVDFQSQAGTGMNLLLGYGGQTIAGPQTQFSGQAVPFSNQVGSGLSATAELIGGAGADVLQLVALGVGSGATIAGGSGALTTGIYTFTAPSFTYTNWSTTDRAYRASDRVAIVVAGTPGSVTLNGSAHVGVQVLSSGSGNDTVNGSNDMDLISGGAGVDQLYGNGGDDTFLATNVIPNNGNGVPGSETTQTFAGSLFDGGAGRDFLAVGGNVNFQGTLVSIEGLYLQPSYNNNLPNNASQLSTVLTIGGATLSSLPSNLIIDGEGEVIVNLAVGDVFNGSGYTFDAGSDVHFKINGTSGNNVITGTANADRIVSGGGQDNLQGGNGDDTIVLDASLAGNSTVNGGAGTDTLELRTIAGIAPAGSSLFPDGIATTSYGLLGTTTLTSIERVDFQSQAGTGMNLLLGYGGQTIAGPQTPVPGQAVPFPNQVGSGLSATAELIGGAGTDVLQIVASGVSSGATIAGGNGALTTGIYTFTAPSFSYTNWSTTDRAYRASDRVAIVVAGTPGSVTLNGSAHVGVQVLSSGSGNDIVNGSNDMDLISGGVGIDQLFGNGGDDTLLATNVVPNNANGVAGGEGTLTFAGSLFDGGAGRDFLAVGGNVNFQGTLVSIEGLYLQPGYSNNLPNNVSQLATVLTISGDQWASLPSNLIIDGVGTITVNLKPGQSFDTSAYVFEQGSNVQLKFVTEGNVADGYIAGAKVYVDINGNGVFDAEEPWTTTDQNGDFTLVSSANGPIRAFGGTNVDTGLPNALQLSAPEGSSVINPLTTLIQAIVETTGASGDTAEQQVKTALGLDASLDLTTLDLLAAAQAGSVDALDAQKAAASLAKVLDAVTDAGGSVDEALQTLAQAVDDAPAGDGLDLTDGALLTEVYSDAGVATNAVAELVAETQAVVEDIQTAGSLDEVSNVQAQDLTLIQGSNGKDVLIGTADNEKINGGNGNDRIDGAGGSDRIYGENGDDELHGGDGIDLLAGGNGNDKLFGDVGNDVLAGGKGADRMNGGEGHDVFTFAKGDAVGGDIITGFEIGSDKLYLATGLTLTGRSENAGGTSISLSDGGSIRLEGVTGLSADPVALAAALTISTLPVWAQSWALA